MKTLARNLTLAALTIILTTPFRALADSDAQVDVSIQLLNPPYGGSSTTNFRHYANQASQTTLNAAFSSMIQRLDYDRAKYERMKRSEELAHHNFAMSIVESMAKKNIGITEEIVRKVYPNDFIYSSQVNAARSALEDSEAKFKVLEKLGARTTAALPSEINPEVFDKAAANLSGFELSSRLRLDIQCEAPLRDIPILMVAKGVKRIERKISGENKHINRIDISLVPRLGEVLDVTTGRFVPAPPSNAPGAPSADAPGVARRVEFANNEECENAAVLFRTQGAISRLNPQLSFDYKSPPSAADKSLFWFNDSGFPASLSKDQLRSAANVGAVTSSIAWKD